MRLTTDSRYTTMKRSSRRQRGVAQPGSAPEWGSGGRRFKSVRPDQPKTNPPPGACNVGQDADSNWAYNAHQVSALQRRPLQWDNDRSLPGRQYWHGGRLSFSGGTPGGRHVSGAFTGRDVCTHAPCGMPRLRLPHARHSLCISGLNIVSRRFTPPGKIARFGRRAKGLFCPNNLYMASLGLPAVAVMPALFLSFSFLLLGLFLGILGLFAFRFFVLFKKVACVHCRGRNVCPNARSMGLADDSAATPTSRKGL
jgi:hypothetical protein